jgi:hypothetical protein
MILLQQKKQKKKKKQLKIVHINRFGYLNNVRTVFKKFIMRLDECKIGTLVQEANQIEPDAKVGYVVGLSVNSFREVIPVVQWAGDIAPYPFHYRNL